MLPAGAPREAAEAKTEISSAARSIVIQMDDLPLNQLWDSVARLEGLGKDAIPAIRKAAGDTGERAKLGAAKALLALGGESDRQEALKEIATLAEAGTDKEVRAAAIEILGDEDPEDSVELIRQIFESSTNDPRIVIPAAKMLWELEQEPFTQSAARKRLLQLVGSSIRNVRVEAALALAQIDCFEGGVREVLRKLRREPSVRGRLAASLLEADNMARREEAMVERGGILPDADPNKVLQEKEKEIRQLEAQIEGMRRSRGSRNTVIEEVIRTIQDNYVDKDKTDRRDLILAAAKGMAKSLDPFSIFFDVEETKRFLTDIKGEYYGIGAQVSKLTDDGPLEVVKPIYGGGAYECGIRTGDKILEVDGFPTQEHPLEEIVDKLLKGPDGTVVKVKVFRRGWAEPREIKIPRRVVVIPSVFHEMLPGQIGYLRLINFGDKSAEEFKLALDDLENRKMEGLILDLRYNPGGRLDVALQIVDLFVGESSRPILTRRNGNSDEVISTPATPDKRPNYPMVILINNKSASASEIVAGALKDFHRATLVGQRSFGKGSVQTLFPLSDSAKRILGGEIRLKLTTQYWYLPSGRCIQTIRDSKGRVIPGKEGGVEPDIEVDMEQYPAWLLEEVEKIRSDNKVMDYLAKNFDQLKPLAIEGDGRDPSRWKDFDALYESLHTKASKEHVRQVLRFHLRRRLEDERGREFPSDYQEDKQLQRAILEGLRKLGKDPDGISEYNGFANG